MRLYSIVRDLDRVDTIGFEGETVSWVVSTHDAEPEVMSKLMSLEVQKYSVQGYSLTCDAEDDVVSRAIDICSKPSEPLKAERPKIKMSALDPEIKTELKSFLTEFLDEYFERKFGK